VFDLFAEMPDEFVSRKPTMEDTEAIVDLINASARDSLGRYAEPTTPNAYLQLLGLPNFDPELDRCVVSTPAGIIVGYSHLVNRLAYMRNNALVHVHPDYLGQGIGTCLTRWAEARARQFIPLAPPGSQVILGCAAVDTHQAARNVLQEQGFKLVRYFWSFKIDLATPFVPQWPGGIAIRHPVKGQDEERLYRAMDEVFKDHWGYTEVPFAEGFKRFRQRDIENNPHYDPTLWFVATDGGEIAGYAICREIKNQSSKKGYVDKLGVRRPWRRRGLALALLQHSFSEFFRRGIQEVHLQVDADSLTGATRLYEKAGMHPYLKKAIYQKVLRAGPNRS
jgi:mycothiol synthase